MTETIFTLFCGLFLTASIQADESCQATLDVVKPRIPDKLCRVTLNQQELGGEIDRRIKNLVYQNYMVVDLDGKWLNHFRNRTDRGDRSHVYYGIGKVFDAGSLFAAYTGDPKVAARTQYIIDELVKSRDADGYLGFWNVEPENRQNHINWILHEQEYINLALVRNYRSTGNPQSLAHARTMGEIRCKLVRWSSLPIGLGKIDGQTSLGHSRLTGNAKCQLGERQWESICCRVCPQSEITARGVASSRSQRRLWGRRRSAGR